MIKESELPYLLIFDLETSSDYSSFRELDQIDPRKVLLWSTKFPDKKYDDHAPLTPEFGRIVCGSFCYFVKTDDAKGWEIRIKSFYDNQNTETSERELVLQPISDMMFAMDRKGISMRLAGHNIKKFDVPFLVKRMIINGVKVPPMLEVWGKKPWEVHHVDTGELWSLGSWEGYVSLDLLTCVLGIDSPKSIMKGEYVGSYFHASKEYDKIKDYCEEVIKAVAKILHLWSKSSLPF